MSDLIEELIHSTIRIEASNGMRGQAGTGFFFSFKVNDTDVPLIVTNRHVLEGMTDVAVHMTHKDVNGNPIYGSHERILVNHIQTVLHPDPNVDLAMMFVGNILNAMTQMGKPVYIKAVGPEQLPTPELLQSLSMFEEVLMIGYPNSLWDPVNNLPIVRRAFTATPFVRDFQGRKEFVIDGACFPGSSGSPIYLYNAGAFQSGGGLVFGTRLALLGVLYAGPQHTAQGEIIIADIPTALTPVPISRIPAHLGYCIKSERIMEFQTIVETRVRAQLASGAPTQQ